MDHVVYRQVAFPVTAFDYLKDWQRAYQARHGITLTNNQALTVILGEHRQQCGLPTNAACEGRDHDRSQASA